MANEIKKKTAIRVGAGATRQAQALAVQAAELGVNVVQYLFAPEGHPSRAVLEELIADQATSLKQALITWDNLVENGETIPSSSEDDA